jgi:hypothetical protein
MTAFVGSRVKEALWPELLGIGAYALGELALANVDAKIATSVKGYPVAQTAGTVAAIAGSVIAIGKDKAPEFSRGVLYGSIVGIVVNLVRSLWEMTKTGVPASASIAQVAALIPMRVTAPGLTGAQQAALQGARQKALANQALRANQMAGAVVEPGLVQLHYE